MRGQVQGETRGSAYVSSAYFLLLAIFTEEMVRAVRRKNEPHR